MFTISILMPETFQVRVPVSVPRKWKKGLQAQNNPPPLPQKNVVLFPLQRPHSPKKVTCELSLLLLSPPSLWASSPGVPRGTGVGEGKGKGELALASHKIEYLRPRMGCEMLIGWFLMRQWCYVPARELDGRLKGETPFSAWNLSNLSPFLPHRQIAPGELARRLGGESNSKLNSHVTFLGEWGLCNGNKTTFFISTLHCYR